MSSDNIDRLKLLLKQAQLNPPPSTHQPPTYHLPDLQVGVGGLVVGNVCGCIVVEKNGEVKQLVMHIICMYNERGEKENVSGQKMKAYIKDYDLKVDLSIFTYLNSFQNLKPGAYLNTIVRRTEKRNQQIFYEMCLNSQLMKFKHPHIKIGIIKDDISIPSSIMKVYQHEQTLPMNFQILYEKDFDNPGLNQSLIDGMRVEEYGSLHPISNVPSLNKLKLNIDKLIYFIKQDSVCSGKKVGKGSL